MPGFARKVKTVLINVIKDLKEHVVIPNREIETIKKKQMRLPVLKNTISTVTNTPDELTRRLNTAEAHKIELENITVAIVLRKA